MEIKVRKKDIIWSYLGYFFQYCTSLLILPLILGNISKGELGLWYSFASIGTLATYLDFGFSTTLVRNITYAWSGADKIQKDGFNTGDVKKNVNIEFIKQVLFACQVVCLVIALVALLLLLTGGMAYVNYVTRYFENQNQAIIAWIIYSVGVFFNLYYNYCANALRGIGMISQYQKILVASRICQILISFIGIQLGLGLIALSLAYVLSGFVIRVCSKIILNKELNRVQSTTKNKNHEKTSERLRNAFEMFKAVWFNAKKTGIISMCSYGINQSLTLICSAYLGVEETASYGLCNQLIVAIMSIAGILFATYQPRMINQMALSKDDEYRKTFSMCMVVFCSIGIAGVLALAIFAEPLLHFMGSNTTLPLGMILLMGLYMLLEYNHGEYTAYFTMRNEIVYLKAYVISSIAIVLCSLIMGKLGYNIYILMLVHLIVQLCFNNWYWPYKAMKLMGTNLVKTIIEGTTEIIGIVKTIIKKRA